LFSCPNLDESGVKISSIKLIYRYNYQTLTLYLQELFLLTGSTGAFLYNVIELRQLGANVAIFSVSSKESFHRASRLLLYLKA
jgi:hypothetical protein